MNGKKVKDYEDICEKLNRDLEKVQQKYNNEVRSVEKEMEALKKSLGDTGDHAKINQQKIVTLEIQNDDYERQTRYRIN